MNELSLFSGAGGGLLATKHLLGWRTIGYIEWGDYCQRVLAARIGDGLLDKAPIFGDISEFLESGAAEEYRGVADVVTAGFPCQPFSSAASGRNNARDYWPECLRVMEVVRPPWCFLENVQFAPIKRACEDLGALGYTCEAAPISASDLAAPHTRLRWWAVAHANGGLQSDGAQHAETPLQQAPGELSAVSWWEAHHHKALGVDHGLAFRLDRLRALGNGQVPAVAAWAWTILSNSLRRSQPGSGIASK